MIRAKLLLDSTSGSDTETKLSFREKEFLVGDLSVNDESDIIVGIDTFLDIEVSAQFSYVLEIGRPYRYLEAFNVTLVIKLNNDIVKEKTIVLGIRDTQILDIRTLKKVKAGDKISIYLMYPISKFTSLLKVLNNSNYTHLTIKN